MAILPHTPFESPSWQVGGHLQTIFPNFMRSIDGVTYERERINTPDDDFLDLDWSKIGSKTLIIISHGFEGNTNKAYVKAMTQLANANDIDSLAWNFRGCSEELNKQLQAYHPGFTQDLEVVINHVIDLQQYDCIYLYGMSMGGNLTLKYLGEKGENLHPKIQKAVAISTPCDLLAAANKFGQYMGFYEEHFLRTIRTKIKKKAEQMPEAFDFEKIMNLKNVRELDEKFTVVINGFHSLEYYYIESSCLYYIPFVTIPTLLLNAKNDPILTHNCFPEHIAAEHPYFHMETPSNGGHAGFSMKGEEIYSWAELRAMGFLLTEQ